MKKLYFVRHGESEMNKAVIWTGSSDAPLTELGHKQAKETGKKIKQQGLAFDVIVSSPMIRAHHTAKHIATTNDYPHEKIILNDKLVERNLGILEGNKPLIDSTLYFIDESSIDQHEGVEPIGDVQKRADEILEYLHSLPHDTILVVGHSAFGRALRRSINKEPIHIRGKSINNAEIVRFI